MRAPLRGTAPRARGTAPGARQAIVTTVIVIAIGLVAAACGGTGRGAAPTTTTAPGGRSATVTPPPGYQWSRLADIPVLGGGPSSTIAAVLPPTQPNGPWLVAGSRTTLAGDVTATSWTSPDAVHWTSSSLGPVGVDSQIRAATQWGSRQLAVGAIGTGAAQRAAVWLSAGPGQPLLPVNDETAFSAPTPTTPPAGDAAGAGAVMDHVATGALGIFASGTVAGLPAMWYSSDGSRWTRLTGAEKVIDAAQEPSINALLVAANGVWAVGSVHNGNQTNAAVWTSTDGIHWYRVLSAQNTFAADGNRVINAIAALGTGFVAVGGVQTGSAWMPASWISPDGVSWSQASEAFPSAPRPTTDDVGTTVNAVTDDLGVGLVAVGGSPAAQRVWTSTDGRSWSEMALPTNAADATDWHLGLVAAFGATTVLIDNTVGAPRLLVDDNGAWKEVTAAPAAFGVPAPQATPSSLISDNGTLYLAVNLHTRSQVLGHSTSNAEVLSSTAGTTWNTDSQSGVFAGQQIRSLLAVQTGLLAAGNTVTASGAVGGAAVWSSPDGIDWTAVTAASGVFGGGPAGPATANALARVGSTVVAVGQAGAGPPAADGQPLTTGAATWVNQDGTWSPAAPLATQPSLATEIPSGACAGPASVVAVGASLGGSPGSRAAAWSSPSGSSWQAAAISPTPAGGAGEGMAGCLTTGNGYLGYGTSPGTSGTADPALWQSQDGTTWTRRAVTAFTGSDGGTISDLALRGTTWLAASGGPLPGAGTATPTATTASCTARLWHSSDAGTTWNSLDTTGAPWTASLDATANLVDFATTNPIVAGTADGQLAIWEGRTTTG